MSLSVQVMDQWTWPWPIWTLHVAYLTSGLVIFAHYLPLLQRAWRFPVATASAQCLTTWAVWTLCRAVAVTYGVFALHDLLFLVVVGTDLLGRLTLGVLIVRARSIATAIGE